MAHRLPLRVTNLRDLRRPAAPVRHFSLPLLSARSVATAAGAWDAVLSECKLRWGGSDEELDLLKAAIALQASEGHGTLSFHDVTAMREFKSWKASVSSSTSTLQPEDTMLSILDPKPGLADSHSSVDFATWVAVREVLYQPDYDIPTHDRIDKSSTSCQPLFFSPASITRRILPFANLFLSPINITPSCRPWKSRE